MISINLQVAHKSFGIGIIIAHEGKYITVKFDAAQKVFVYPDAFAHFLTLADGTVSDEIRADIEEAERAKQAIIDKNNEENLVAMQKGIVIPGKEGALTETEDEEGRYKTSDTEET